MLTNLASAQSELQSDLQEVKSALEVNISELNARANSVDMQLANLTATLDKAHDTFQRNISLLRAEVFSRFSTIESQLDTYANRTDAQLSDLTSTLSEMRHNLTSTRQELLASKSAIDLLIVRANSTELQLRNLTSTLGELHGDIGDNQHQLKNLSSTHEGHEHKINQITLNMSRFHENVSLSQQINAREISALHSNVSSLNSQISTNHNQIQGLSKEQSRLNARLREIEAKVNSASTYPQLLYI